MCRSFEKKENGKRKKKKKDKRDERGESDQKGRDKAQRPTMHSSLHWNSTLRSWPVDNTNIDQLDCFQIWIGPEEA